MSMQKGPPTLRAVEIYSGDHVEALASADQQQKPRIFHSLQIGVAGMCMFATKPEIALLPGAHSELPPLRTSQSVLRPPFHPELEAIS
jgi:hypothetical protein